ncbi:hypothetical protein SASPL_104356 [Salvia splendens]|uniref:F-box domain-containing protein n=1 Tax=Salvia splendens TaxID=180675 RepID=A0A8X8YJ40_SALSN|nr:hypothetical protein SASPL_104356 [Salvia splendens]
MCSTTTSDHGGATSIAAIHPDIIQSHILNGLDGPALASTKLLSLCSDDFLWRQICNSTWPSTAHPTVLHAISSHRAPSTPTPSPPPIYSRVKETETLSGWFQSSAFRIDLVDAKEAVGAAPLKFNGACMELAKERLRVSWILIDPRKKRAVNIASAAAVEARRHWLTDDIHLRYATVVDGGDGELVQCTAVVTCGGKEGGELQVREMSMQVEDMDGKIMTGSDRLRILDAAMDGRRVKSQVETQREAFEMFLRIKMLSRERKQRRERSLDMICIAAGVAIFVAILAFVLSR